MGIGVYMDSQIFTDRIKSLLQSKKVTQKQFLEDVGLSPNSFTRWVTEQRIPRSDTLGKIADYLEVSVDFLLGDDSTQLSTNEMELLISYRKLRPEYQELVRTTITHLLQIK